MVNTSQRTFIAPSTIIRSVQCDLPEVKLGVPVMAVAAAPHAEIFDWYYRKILFQRVCVNKNLFFHNNFDSHFMFIIKKRLILYHAIGIWMDICI